jgi:IS30 family transposase
VSPHRWDFISDNRADFGVKRICRVLGASRAGCYRHLATEQVRTERQAEEKRAVSEIRAIHAEHQGAYGAPRVHAELRARGRRINRKRVTRLMRINHIVGRHLRKKKRTTIADRAAPPTPDLVMRDFTADTNGLLRQYFPKGTDLSRWSFTDLEAVAMAINNRPRKTLGWRTPAEVFEEQLRSLQQPGVATTG